VAFGLGLLAVVGTPAYGQILRRCPPPPCEQPAPVVKPEVTIPPPSTKEPVTPTVPTPTIPEERFAALTSETVALESPNMIGNLLFGSHSVGFFINRTQGATFINSLGSTNISNPKVADDNSPIPRDRFSFRYNFFHDAQQVTGISSAPGVFDPQLQAFVQGTTTKNYNVNEYTFQFEKTFLNQQASIELRVPFSTGLASKLNLSAANVTGIGQGVDLNGVPLVPPVQAIQVVETPQNTLGHEDTEWGNLSLIFKGLLCKNNCFAISAGLALGIPTGQDTDVTVTDFLGDPAFNNLSIQRVRDFHVDNDTWSLSPFIGALWTPGPRFFSQGFLAVDVPLNSSKFSFNETAPIVLNGPFPSGALPGITPPFSVDGRIAEQTLLQVDWGAGFWLMRNPNSSWITGIAPTLELHYTYTLDNAQIINLPHDTTGVITPIPGAPPGTVQLSSAPNPTIGNLRNRLDILDLTVGTTFAVGQRCTVAPAFSFPLRGGDDRTYDWEFQLQFNYYFGGTPRTPNF
jgi:hypothetical protein